MLFFVTGVGVLGGSTIEFVVSQIQRALVIALFFYHFSILFHFPPFPLLRYQFYVVAFFYRSLIHSIYSLLALPQTRQLYH